METLTKALGAVYTVNKDNNDNGIHGRVGRCEGRIIHDRRVKISFSNQRKAFWDGDEKLNTAADDTLTLYIFIYIYSTPYIEPQWYTGTLTHSPTTAPTDVPKNSKILECGCDATNGKAPIKTERTFITMGSGLRVNGGPNGALGCLSALVTVKLNFCVGATRLCLKLLPCLLICVCICVICWWLLYFVTSDDIYMRLAMPRCHF